MTVSLVLIRGCIVYWQRHVCTLQSSLNAEDGMGVISLSVIYGAIILSSMFLPPIMIKNLGCKWTIVLSMGCYVAYSFGNLLPGWCVHFSAFCTYWFLCWTILTIKHIYLHYKFKMALFFVQVWDTVSNTRHERTNVC